AAALRDQDKASRTRKVNELKESIREEFTEEERERWSRALNVELKALEKHAMRDMVIDTGERVDGRTATEIRPLMVKPDYLPLVHGSGLFQRGQTQVLSVCTLGMLNEWQRLDTIEPVDGKRYIHHYNFPPYCTGETGRLGAPKRREIGHGNLAERALLPMIPSEEEFPYAIRVVSEVMESNGSSSMASTCGIHPRPHGRRRAPQAAGLRHRHGPHPGEGKTVVLPTSRASRTSSATWTSRSPAPSAASRRCRWTTRPPGLTFD
ncbi:polyribonucleotide nucleotidyltransferase, partial [gut metagenome]